MSELKVDFNCPEEQESKDELFVSAMGEPEKSLKLESESTAELQQVQRRQSIVFENAQEKVTALETLLNAVAPDWSKPAKAVTTAGTATQRCPPPQAYHFKDIYEHKKQQLLHKLLEQERNQRQFHSRPMPNFSHVHQQQANKQVVHRVTRPVTPNVLKSSREMLLKRSQKVEQVIQQRELQQQQELQLRPKTKPVPKSNVIPLKVNNCQLIAPLPLPPLLAPKPFQFSTERRAEQRKRFNAQSQQMQENRRREQEEQRRKLEHQEYQRHRQLATFRARPNPFRPHI